MIPITILDLRNLRSILPTVKASWRMSFSQLPSLRSTALRAFSLTHYTREVISYPYTLYRQFLILFYGISGIRGTNMGEKVPLSDFVEFGVANEDGTGKTENFFKSIEAGTST